MRYKEWLLAGTSGLLGTSWLSWALILFLLPVSLNIGGAGVSANYAFFVLLLLPKQLVAGSRLVAITFTFSVICWLVAVLVFRDFEASFLLRQFLSFLLFLAPLCIALVPLPFDFTMLARATVWVSVGYACVMMIAILATGTPVTHGPLVKAELAAWVPDWPQHYIIVVMLGFFLAVYLGGQARRWLLAAGVCGFCIAVSHGVATGLAMLSAVTLLAMLYWQRRDWHGFKRLSLSLSLSLLLIVAFAGNETDRFWTSEKNRAYAISPLVQVERSLMGNPLSRSSDMQSTIDHIYAEGGEASGKIRLEIWSTLVRRMIDDKMWLGSGFAGPYLFDAAIGSPHSQYVDVLFRTGPIGLVLYLGLWGVLVWRSFRHSPELGCGILAWFIYGFFHETTKYSYGAFLFFSLFSLSWFGWNRKSTSDRDLVRA